MDECPGYRPKLFWTYNDATSDELVGTEKVFPGPGAAFSYAIRLIQLSPMPQLTHHSAGQIGLFQPNWRVVPRDRRSQHDRGTPRQMQEDASYYYAHAFGGVGTPAM
ncbi:hypothetical protein PRZ48_008953 [Zasmidium cellare]|uniref:Uncharacterized protein n=1 Tax=Zasmidium cellare TaxID=395010 RepID=A0ABR0EHT7_ZASCE|nr:hypothetical protein PRZ48_008953 [Zasmidium cellare]